MATNIGRRPAGSDRLPISVAGSARRRPPDPFWCTSENGLELVGPSGDLTLTVTTTNFLRNHSKGEVNFGTPHSVPGGAILVRDTPKITSATIRNCEFRTNGVDIQWDPDPTSPANSLNLGIASSLGQNNFCKDFSPFDDFPDPEPPDPYLVSLFLKSVTTVDAVGNFWIANNQGANAAGHLLAGSVTATTLALGNLFAVDPFSGVPLNPPKPPGPMWGEFQPAPAPPMTSFLRNYAMVLGATINFGVDPPNGTKPDCAVPP